MDKKFVMSIAAMAALTLVSCSSDDLDSFSDNSSKNEAISFDGYLGRSAVAVNGTRGSVETVKTLKANGFGVFSTHTGNQASFSDFSNQQVTYKYSKWTYTPIKYWPTTQGTINFFAYAPYDKNTTLTENTKINFTVEKNVANQKDLLWSRVKAQINTPITSTNNKVKFQFAHALSRLGYTVADKLYVIVEYTIKDYNGVTTPMKNTVYQKLEKNFERGKAYTLNLTLVKEKSKRVIYTWTPPDTEDGGDLKLTASQLDHTCAKIENNPNSYLYVIPQKKNEAFFLKITYTVQQGTSQQTIMVRKNLLDVNNPFNFEKRKTYLLHLKLSLGSTRSRSSASEDCSVTMSVSSIPE